MLVTKDIAYLEVVQYSLYYYMFVSYGKVDRIFIHTQFIEEL